MGTLIKRNSPIPTLGVKTYTTEVENQTSILFEVFEGEARSTLYNNRIGSFRFENIQPAPRKVPKIEVTMQHNQDGILQISAKDLGTGQKIEQIIEVNRNRLTEEQVKASIAIAILFRKEDELRRMLITANNEVLDRAHNLKRRLNEEDKLDGSEIGQSNKRILKETIEGIIQWADVKLIDERELTDYDVQKQALGDIEEEVCDQIGIFINEERDV